MAEEAGATGADSNPQAASTPTPAPAAIPATATIPAAASVAVPTAKPVIPSTPAPHPLAATMVMPRTPPPAAPETEPAPPPARPMTDVQADIAKILADTKLPERRDDVRGGADAAPRKPVVQPKPAPAPKSSSEDAPKQEGSVFPVRTFHHDLQTVVKDSQLSLVQAAALEEDKRAHREPEPQSVHAATVRSYAAPIMLALSFIALGILLLGAILFIVREQTVGDSSQFGTNLIFAEQSAAFPLVENPQDIKRSLAAARTSGGLTLGSITRLVPTTDETDPNTGALIEREATAQEFIRALDMQIPEELVRTLEDEFFFGFHSVDEQAPVLVFRISSYERAFGGMLAWEKTLNTDLAPIFTGLSPLIKNAEGLVVQRTFIDTVIQNFDVRALKDDAGTIQLYYSFPTRSLLIISESQYSFPEVLSRLRAERKI